MTTPIVRFIEDRITADEQRAQAAAQQSSPNWWVDDDKHSAHIWGGEKIPAVPEWAVPAIGEHTIVYDEGCPDRAEAVHIAANDPADTLNRCAVYRRLLAEELANRVGWDGEMCACDEYEVLGGHCDTWTPEKSRLLHALASLWREHPDFRPEWTLPKD
jgi:hypothetical protein